MFGALHLLFAKTTETLIPWDERMVSFRLTTTFQCQRMVGKEHGGKLGGYSVLSHIKVVGTKQVDHRRWGKLGNWNGGGEVDI